MMVGCSLLPDEMKRAEQMMETNPDSALYILQHMEQTHKLTDSNRALYGILLFQALDKNNKPLGPDSVINFSVRYYEETKDKVKLATGYYYKAKRSKDILQYDEATVLYLKALDYSHDKKDNYLLGKIYADMGYICAIQQDFKESLRKHQLSAHYYKKGEKNIDASYSILDIGRTYRLMREHQMAHKYYKQAIVLTNDSIVCGMAFQEIGINYYWAKQYDSAQFYLQKSLLYPYRSINYSIRCFTLADLYYDTKQYDSAYQYASKALQYPASFFTQRDCYRILANTEYLRGNFKEMANFMTKFQLCYDSVRKVETQTRTTVLENLHHSSVTVHKTKKYLLMLGWLLPVILTISFTIFYHLRKRNQGKEKKLKEVEVQLTQKQNLLVNSLIQKIEETRAAQLNAYKKATLAEREQIIKEMYIKCLHLNNWQSFQELMNKTFNDLLNQLDNNYSDITHKEMIWCCLFLLDIPTTDMAIVLDSQMGSLYKLKSRLTKKMNLKSTKELDQLLKQKSEGK